MIDNKSTLSFITEPISATYCTQYFEKQEVPLRISTQYELSSPAVSIKGSKGRADSSPIRPVPVADKSVLAWASAMAADSSCCCTLAHNEGW